MTEEMVHGLAEALARRQWKIVFAESCTGGLVSARIRGWRSRWVRGRADYSWDFARWLPLLSWVGLSSEGERRLRQEVLAVDRPASEAPDPSHGPSKFDEAVRSRATKSFAHGGGRLH